MRFDVLQRSLVLVAASAVALTAFAAAGPLPAVADPAPPPTGSPATTTVTPLAIPTASTKQKQLSRQQSDARMGPAQTTGQNLLATLPEQTTTQFSTVGVTWRPASGSAAATVVVRTHPVDGTWTDWVELENESTETPAEADRIGTAPIYVGESDGIEVRVTSAGVSTTLPELQVSLVESPEVAADRNPATAAAAAASPAPALPYLYPRPAIVSRAGWGADESWRNCTSDIDDTIKGAVVHHTAGSNDYSASASASVIRGIYAYHTKTLGWCDIGYNFLVDKYGKTYEGRSGGMYLPVHGAHATSWNTNTVGVSIMGNFETATPSAAVMESVSKVLAWKLEANYRNPKAKVTLAGKSVYTIFGHGDVMSTACPGKNVRSRMGALRDSVAAKIGSYNTPIYQKWQALGGESGSIGSPYIGEESVSDGRYTRFTGASLYYKPSLGTFVVKGDVRARYDATRSTNGVLGWPTSDEVTGRSKVSTVARFQGGKIYRSSTVRAHSVYRAIHGKYVSYGEDTSRLGLPVNEQTPAAAAGGIKQQFAGGYLIWGSSTGVQPLWGGIGKRYIAYSAGAQRAIGLPTAAERKTSVGAYVQPFQHGALYWYSGVAGYAIHSAIWTAYAGVGADTGRLGLPTSHNTVTSTGEYANFQHGTITWVRATNKTTITYR